MIWMTFWLEIGIFKVFHRCVLSLSQNSFITIEVLWLMKAIFDCWRRRRQCSLLIDIYDSSGVHENGEIWHFFPDSIHSLSYFTFSLLPKCTHFSKKIIFCADFMLHGMWNMKLIEEDGGDDEVTSFQSKINLKYFFNE